jgi:hypothetical protein
VPVPLPGRLLVCVYIPVPITETARGRRKAERAAGTGLAL